MLRHLELAVVCRDEGDVYTHHSFGYDAMAARANFTTHVTCGIACFAPSKSDFVFSRTLRHIKVRKRARDTENDNALDLGAAEAVDSDELAALTSVVAEHVSACPAAGGKFLKSASPCCHRPLALLEVLRSPGACATQDNSPPDVCDASCFLALQMVLSPNETNGDDEFCEAYGPIQRGLATLLDAVCTRHEDQTCASKLADAAMNAWPIVQSPPASANTTAETAEAGAEAGAEAADADAAAETAEASFLQSPDVALLARGLRASAQGTALAHIASAVSKIREGGDTASALQSICTPCYYRALGAGLGLFDAFINAEEFVSRDLVSSFSTTLMEFLPLPDGWEAEGTKDLRALRSVAAATLTGVCQRDEAGAFCYPTVQANAAEATGATQCGSRCGKLGAQLGLWKGEHSAHFPKGDVGQLAKGVTLIDGGCSAREETYCVDEFWAYVGSLSDLQAIVELWTSGCMTASTEGGCGECGEILASLDHFGCCRGKIMEGVLLLAARGTELERWGFTEEGRAKHLNAEAQQDAIRAGIKRWGAACDRKEWSDPCETCTQQVALALAMPAGVTRSELEGSQFVVEEALLDDLALTAREPRRNLRVLDFTPRGPSYENVSVVVGLNGENCPLTSLAAKALRNRVQEEGIVFAHTPAALHDVADPVAELVSFSLQYDNATLDTAGVASLRQTLAKDMDVDVADVDIPTVEATGGGTRVAGMVHGATPAKAKSFADGLKTKESSSLPLLSSSDVEVSIRPNEPIVGLENRSANEAFGPNNCVHISQAESGECVLTTRNCNLDLLKAFEMAFVCKLPSKELEKHSYGRGGGLGKVAFDQSESFNTGIECLECLVPPPPAKPKEAPKESASAPIAIALLIFNLL
jgi:hypothetical protein